MFLTLKKITFCCIFLYLFFGCDSKTDPKATPQEDTSKSQTKETSVANPTVPENFIQVSKQIYSGGEPNRPEHFEALAKSGVKTIVSVDGAKPNIEEARKHGIRYVHIPIGYDGIPEPAQKQLLRLTQEVKGPYFVHCHHGKHRGPAAVALIGINLKEKDTSSALEFLEKAGTSKSYAGLWKCVQEYKLPTLDENTPELKEVAEVESLASAMADMDRIHDQLILCEKQGWKSPPEHPDLKPAQQALLLKELFRESQRTLSKEHQEIAEGLNLSEKLSEELEQALNANNTVSASKSFSELRKSCTACHKEYRN